MTSARPKPPFPRLFVAVTFAAATIVGVLVLYFGLTGQLGATIP
jgi:hypothetical protein